jgi:hypothetical protein
MKRTFVLPAAIVIVIACATVSQSQTPAQQTARQALIEMFFSKTPGTFVKHLPAITRATLEKTGAMENLHQYSLLMNQFQTQGQAPQTFDTGSVLLSADNTKTGDKVEIMVEDDSVHGDADDIRLSFQVYKNGVLDRKPYMPQMIFSMKKEAQLWTLNEVSITLHLPLADPDTLKAFTEGMQARSQAQRATFVPRSEVPAQLAGSDAMVLAAMHQILAAEATYSSTYATVGYTCTLSNLDGFGGGEPNEHQAMLISSGLASGKKYGFVFTLSDCTGTPSTAFRLTAAPSANTFGRKAFCADQTGVIRSSDDPATCLASGTPAEQKPGESAAVR